MASPSALSTLIDLANKETDEAAKLLGAALRTGDEAAQKLTCCCSTATTMRNAARTP